MFTLQSYMAQIDLSHENMGRLKLTRINSEGIRNDIYHKAWNEIIYQFPRFNRWSLAMEK